MKEHFIKTNIIYVDFLCLFFIFYKYGYMATNKKRGKHADSPTRNSIKRKIKTRQQMCRLTRQGNPDTDDDNNAATADESNPIMSPFQVTQKVSWMSL